MASTDGSKRIDPSEGGGVPEAAARPKTAAQRRAEEHAGTDDPSVLAEDIERTREELAETLDSIADKVSPKRVTKRATTGARAKAHDAAETVKAKAHDAAESVKGKAEQVSEQVGGHDPATSELGPLGTAPVTPPGQEAVVGITPENRPVVATVPTSQMQSYTMGSPAVPRELAAGIGAGVVALLGVWLWRRRR